MKNAFILKGLQIIFWGAIPIAFPLINIVFHLCFLYYIIFSVYKWANSIHFLGPSMDTIRINGFDALTPLKINTWIININNICLLTITYRLKNKIFNLVAKYFMFNRIAAKNMKKNIRKIFAPPCVLLYL